MIQNFTKEDYAKAYTELNEILKYIPKEFISKIPKAKYQNYIKNRDINYKFFYDSSQSLENQKILKLTKILIANLYIDYWANDEEKKAIRIKEQRELYDLDQKKKEKYNPDTIFLKDDITKSNSNKSIAVIKNKNLFERFLDKIKQIIMKK